MLSLSIQTISVMTALRCASPGGLCRSLVLLLVGLLVAVPGRAQDTGTITGTVVDANTQEPLSDINVVVAGTLMGATTGPDGTFRIEDVPPDEYDVQVSALDYRTARWTVEVEAGETVEVTFRLSPASEQDRGEAVEAEVLQPLAEIGTRRFREENASDPGIVLRRMAGVGAARHGALGFSSNVRGLTDAQLGTFIDGVRTFAASPLPMDAPMSYVDPGTVERIEVVKGPYALTQGAGVMSAVRVETPDLESESDMTGWLQGGFQGNGKESGTAGAMRSVLFSAPFRVQAAYRTGRDYETGDGQRVPAAYTSGAVRGRVDVPMAGGAQLAMWGQVQDQRDVRYPGVLLDADFLTSGQGAMRYQVDRETGPVRRVEAQITAMQTLRAMSDDEKPPVDPDLPERVFERAIDAETQQFGGHVATEFAPIRDLQLTLGGDAYHVYRDATHSLRLRETGEVPPVVASEEVWPGVRSTEVGAFAYGTRPLGAVDAAGAIRLDLARADASRASDAFLENAGGSPRDDLDASDVYWSGMLTLTTTLTPAWTVSLGAGSVARAADAFERYADRFPAGRNRTSAEMQGTPDLNPERSTQGDLWLRGEFEWGNVQLNGFARRIDDYITMEPTDIDPMLPFSPETVFRYVNGTATFYGIDAAGRFDVNPLVTLRGQASYLWGQDRTLDEPAFGILPPMADLGLRFQVPFNEDLFLEAITHFAAEQSRVATTRGETSTDGYVTLDLRLGFVPAARTSFVFSIENVTDASYVYPLNAHNPFDGAPIPEPGRAFGMNLRVNF